MTAATTAPHVDLATLLREASAADHRAAESRGYVVRLMAGELSLAEYARYLSQLAPVYAALEARPSGGWAVFEPGFARSERLRADLDALGGPRPALPAARAHADRIAGFVAAGDDVRYLAHHYTRYLGDLSGGQAIGALMARHYDAAPEQLTFFDFAGLGKPVEVKRRYREQLNALELGSDDVEALVDEVRIAFGMTSAVFDALDDALDDAHEVALDGADAALR